MEENITDAESTIRDTDVAEEMMSYTKNNILIQSAQAMLAQANQVPQGVLQLLQYSGAVVLSQQPQGGRALRPAPVFLC